MKKLLALFVVLIMVTSVVMSASCVFADETPIVDYSDKVSVDKGNLIKDPENLTYLQNSNNHGSFAEVVSESHITWQDKTINSETEASFVAGPTRLAYKSNGVEMGHFVDGFGTKGWEKGKTYVYSVRLKNSAPDKNSSPLFGMAFGWYREAEDNNAVVTFEVENSEDYKTYTGYWTSQLERNNTALSMGFAYVDAVLPYTARGSKISMDISNGGSLLVAEEAATEITTELVGNAVIPLGGSTVVKAEVLNQIGEKGNVAQDITWIPLNADRTGVTDDITITDNGNGTAEITANVEGDYVILAKSGILQKGVKISVVDFDLSEFQDNASVDKGNLIKDPDNETHLRHTNGQGGDIVDFVAGSHITWQDKSVEKQGDIPFMAGPTYLAYVANGKYPGHFVDGFTDTAGWTVGDTFVWSVRLKNSAPDKDESPMFGMSFDTTWSYKDQGALVNFEVTNTEFKTYTGYYTSPKNNCRISMGFTALSRPYTAVGGQISMDLSNGGSLMVAREAATEITNEVVGNSKITAGDTATLKAEVLNQIGEKGNIPQSIKWIVLNADRTAMVDDLVVISNSDGTATVKAGPKAKGTYVILASSEESELRKGVEIEVLGAPEVAEASVITEDGKAYFNYAKVENAEEGKEVMFVVASYDVDSKKMTDAKSAKATVVNGVAQLAQSIEITVDAGNKVRIFVWYSDTLTPIEFGDGVVKEI